MVRDKLYTKYLSEISSLAEKLDNALDNLPSCCDKETMEEDEIRTALYRAAEKLNDAKYAIEHFSKPAEEGYLEGNHTGKFVIGYNKGGFSYPLSCGSPIEVYLKEDSEQGIEEGWHAGRVEHTSRDGQSGYYFYGPGKPFLCNGMKVRTRE